MRRLFARLAWFSLGVVLTLAVLEGVLRLLPVSVGLQRTEDYARWPLQNTPPHLPWSYSISWAMLNAHRGVTNNYGHVAPFDFQKGSHPVIVVGDSYVESLMNDYGDTLQGQLGEKIGAPRSVYGLGVSGLSASDYVALSRLARDDFAPSAAVFLVTDGDLSESLERKRGSYFLVPRADSLRLEYEPVRGESLATRVRKLIGDVSLHRYMQVNLQFSPEQIVKPFRQDAPAKPAAAPARDAVAEQRRVADWFLSELPGSLGLPPECIVLLLDTDRYAIYSPKLASARKDDPRAREYLGQRARELGFGVSDLDDVFKRRFAQDRARFDHYPIDRHWNRLGHGIGAEESYRLLFQTAPGRQHACSGGKRATEPPRP